MKRLKLLLINPHIEDFSAYDHFSKPLGLIRLAAYLKPHFDLHFINALNRDRTKIKNDGTGDFPKQVIPKPELLRDIPRYFRRYGIDDEAFLTELENTPFNPDYVFVTSGMTYWYTGLRHTVGLIRRAFPGTPIVVGGIYATLLPGHAREQTGADVVIAGQKIAAVLKDISALTGVDIPYGGYRNPAYELLEEYHYLPLLTSTGCVYRCDYCAGHRLNDFAQFDPNTVAELIVNTHRQYGTTNYAFYDDALLANPVQHIVPLLENVIDSEIKIRFYTPNGLHIRFLNREVAELMKRAGFAEIRISLESGDPRFHRSEDRKTTLAEFRRTVNHLRRAGFDASQIQVYTLVNVPRHNPSDIMDTLRFIQDTGAVPRTALYSPIPGTPDYLHAERITNVDEPLFQNNTVYLYRSGFDMELLKEIRAFELECRRGIPS